VAHVTGDRVKDTTISTGTGNITVSGSAPTGFRTLSTVATADGDTLFIAIVGGSEWEVCLATRVSANVYSRATPLASSTGSAVSFSAGTKDVFITLPAARIAGRQEIWIPAGAMVPQVTNGAAEGSGETTTNDVMRRTLDYDPTTAEYAQFSWRMPKSWNEGTVTFIPIWSHPSTTTNFGVVWDMCGVALSNDDALDTAFGTAQTSTDTGGTTDDIYEGPESSAITIAGTPTVGDVVHFRVARAPSNGSDTMAVDARLHGVVLVITTDALSDA
jgi:hypothetical protein